MHILLVKTSSMGDVIHALPALSDACRHHPELRCDWLVEEGFAALPSWHPGVAEVIPVALRRWRRERLQARGEVIRFLRQLRSRRYDLVIDAQGLLKSALLTLLAPGPGCGPGWGSAREGWAPWCYRRRIALTPGGHSLERNRRLFAAALEYPYPTSPPDYQLSRLPGGEPPLAAPYFTFITGTTWPTKHWPEGQWQALLRLASREATVALPWGTPTELERVRRLAAALPHATWIPPRMNLERLAHLLKGSRGVVAVDTGPGHLAAALGVPCVSVYGPTTPTRTGTVGSNQLHCAATLRCAPCFSRVCITAPHHESPPCHATTPPELVWERLRQLVK